MAAQCARWRRIPGLLAGIGAGIGALFGASLASANPPARPADTEAFASKRGGRVQALWVFFEPPVASAAELSELDRRLAVREAELGPRTLARRAKARKGPLVDARDLAPDAAWVQAVEATGARVRVTSRWLAAVSVEADAQQARKIAALPFVRELRPVGRGARRPVTPPPMADAGPRGPRLGGEVSDPQLELLGADFLHDCGLRGTGVVVGVQDTGFDLSHPSLSGVQVLAARDFVDGDDDVGPEADDAEGQSAHGTMVLSILAGLEPGRYAGVAPGVSVVLTKTEDVSQEMPFEEDLYVAGLEFIEAQGADLFTASLGYVDWYGPEDLDGATPVTTQAVEVAVQNGLIVLNAVGNGGAEGPSLVAPADAPSILSIGSVDPRGALSWFSSWGPTADGRVKPELLAPGEEVQVADWGSAQGYRRVNGTSFATPMAAGLVALLLEAEPELGPSELRERLTESANPWVNPGPGPANGYGWGLIDGQRVAPQSCQCSDVDEDGATSTLCGGTDCDDADPEVGVGQNERCNRRDDDCDGELLPGELDLDRDGWASCEGDCADEDPSVHPGRTEQCDNGIDDDCNGDVDAADEACEASGADAGGTGEVGTGASAESGQGGQGCACVVGQGPGGRAWSLAMLGLLGWRARRQRPLARRDGPGGRA